MKFEPIEPTDRAPTVVAVRSGDARERHEALLSLALRDRDWRFVQELCLDIITGDPDLDLRATAEQVVNVRASWKKNSWMVYGELLNVLDSRGKDIVYYYDTFIPGITPPGTEAPARLSRSVEPRTVRLGLRYTL